MTVFLKFQKTLSFFSIFLYNYDRKIVYQKGMSALMKFRLDDKQRGIARTAVWIFSVCLLIGIAVWRWTALVDFLKKFLTVMSPVLTGLIIAYLFAPLASWIENHLRKYIERKKPHPKICRGIAVFLTMLIILLSIFALIAAIVPQLGTSLKNLLVSLPEYMTSATQWINNRIAGLEHDQPQIYSALYSAWETAQSSLNNYANEFQPQLDSIASSGFDIISIITSGAKSVINWLMNFLLGMIIAVYLLYNKERYLAQARKFLYAMLPEEHVHTFLRIGSHVSYTFMHFLSGKTLDSLIIGLLCFIGMTILKMPYIPLISILVGVTNIIPFFGPILGAVPSGLLVLLSEPRKVIPFVIFILILQQFDGNILGPKILGDTLGLPMFWILFAITVGGGMFGFLGMVAFVPMFAAVYTLLSDFLSDKLSKKGLPADTESYVTNMLHSAKSVIPEEVYEINTDELTEDELSPESDMQVADKQEIPPFADDKSPQVRLPKIDIKQNLQNLRHGIENTVAERKQPDKSEPKQEHDE